MFENKGTIKEIIYFDGGLKVKIKILLDLNVSFDDKGSKVNLYCLGKNKNETFFKNKNQYKFAGKKLNLYKKYCSLNCVFLPLDVNIFYSCNIKGTLQLNKKYIFKLDLNNRKVEEIRDICE